MEVGDYIRNDYFGIGKIIVGIVLLILFIFIAFIKSDKYERTRCINKGGSVIERGYGFYEGCIYNK